MKIANDKGVDISVNLVENMMNGSTMFIFVRLFYILGVFLALSFVVETGSIIYFRIVLQGSDDRQTYQMLYKMGLPQSDINRIMYRQLLMFFICPILIAFVHSAFASKALEAFMAVRLIIPLLYSTGIIAAIFFIYYLITIQKYKIIVLE